MPRENSFSDSDGRSLTPDLEEELVRERNGGVSPRPTPISPLKSRESTHLHHFPNPRSPAKTHKSSGAFDPWNGLTPLEKFRAVVRRVMFMNRGTSLLANGGGRIGAEPGINPRRASAELLYGHIHQRCTVEIMDYSAVRSSVGRMTNEEFIGLMQDPVASTRESWVKVRWINIGGISWDVIKALSLKYGLLFLWFILLFFSSMYRLLDLHPLALEDVFHTRSQNRSKADYYSKHLFLRVLCHELVKGEQPGSSHSSHLTSFLPGAHRSASPDPFDAEASDKTVEDDPSLATIPRKRKRFFPLRSKTLGDLEATIGNGPGSRSSFSRFLKNRTLVVRLLYRLLGHALTFCRTGNVRLNKSHLTR